MTAYANAWKYLSKHETSGSSIQMAKFVLSLYNEENAFSLRECTRTIDEEGDRIIIDLVAHFLNVGEDRELVDIGAKIEKLYPHLIKIGYAGHLAKIECAKKFE